MAGPRVVHSPCGKLAEIIHSAEALMPSRFLVLNEAQEAALFKQDPTKKDRGSF